MRMMGRGGWTSVCNVAGAIISAGRTGSDADRLCGVSSGGIDGSFDLKRSASGSGAGCIRSSCFGAAIGGVDTELGDVEIAGG